MNKDIDFCDAFQALTGNPPLSWQKRLYDCFVSEHLPGIIDLPTGLGKTMVMVIWLIARSLYPGKTPTRLIYVVDRRTVVDQASEIGFDLAFLLAPRDENENKKFAEQKPELIERKKKHSGILDYLRQKLCPNGGRLAVSTLRGQLADNREWSRDPSCPTIIIGTVDLIGSGLLFSGYRSGFKTKPLHAGLLGQDSLLVLDEAHLSKPFQKLIQSISGFQKSHGKPMCVVRMSATSASDDASRFTLEQSDLDDKVSKERFNAKKRLKVETTDNVIGSIATAAGEIASHKPGSRIVIFVKSPKEVEAVRKALIKKNESGKTKIAMLTGTMRGLERDELVTPPTQEDQHERRVMQRFLSPENDPSLGACFLIATSAGEVGFDLNADDLVGDESTFDSWIQRLGRVNRRGNGDATVVLVKATKPADTTDFDKACIETSKLLSDGMDVSPRALAAFKKSLTPEQLKDASAPEPTMVELTDILLDAWSMTSITNPMPGRPEVGPWLRGIANDLPQTTIAWRAELDLPGFAELDLDTIEDWFDTHRILTHETLSVPTSAAAKWLTDRWGKLDDRRKSEVGSRAIVVDRAGLKLVTVNEVISQLGRNTDSIRNADLILPASLGGIERGKGLLDADAPEVPKDESKQSAEDRAKAIASRQAAPDVADQHGRYREIVTKTEEGEPDVRPISRGAKPPKPARFAIELESDDDKRVQLISYIRKQEKPEWGSTKQTLGHHVELVCKRINEILSRMSIDVAVKHAAQLAADFHDHGKNRERWERTVGGTATVGTTDWMQQKELEGDGGHQCLGKPGGEMKRDPRGYRHEFGSLREFIDAHKEAKFADSTGKDITKEVIDLALHLIAVHHGRGRPHFSKGGFDPDCESRSDEIHTESIRRFARLQRKYGWWHLAWLENLLRCADAMASSEQDAAGGAK